MTIVLIWRLNTVFSWVPGLLFSETFHVLYPPSPLCLGSVFLDLDCSSLSFFLAFLLVPSTLPGFMGGRWTHTVHTHTYTLFLIRPAPKSLHASCWPPISWLAMPCQSITQVGPMARLQLDNAGLAAAAAMHRERVTQHPQNCLLFLLYGFLFSGGRVSRARRTSFRVLISRF
ncbi:hypothetical protein ACQKWADRAFT_289553 [Trichoderma austrokoningii]